MVNNKRVKPVKINVNSIIRIDHKNFYNPNVIKGLPENFSEDNLNAFMQIQKNSWKSIFWFVLIITIPISIFLNFYSAYLIIKTKWLNKKINRMKYLWSILTIFPLGYFGSLIFSFKGLKAMMFLELTK